VGWSAGFGCSASGPSGWGEEERGFGGAQGADHDRVFEESFTIIFMVLLIFAMYSTRPCSMGQKRGGLEMFLLDGDVRECVELGG